MEPKRLGLRPKYMLADTPSIRAFGDAQAGHAAALDAVRVILASAQPTPDALGPAGAGFTRALGTAVRLHAERVARLSGIASDRGATAHANAAAYIAADARNRRSITEVEA